jgi:hypothetical protein
VATDEPEPPYPDWWRAVLRLLDEGTSDEEIMGALGLSRMGLLAFTMHLAEERDARERRRFGLPADGGEGWLAPSEQWRPAADRTCPRCGSVYAMQALRLVYVATERLACGVCGGVLYAWHAPYDYEATLLVRGTPPPAPS